MKIKIPADWVLALMVVCFTGVALVFSTLGIVSFLWHFSWVAAVFYLLSIPAITFVLHEVSVLGSREGYEEL